MDKVRYNVLNCINALQRFCTYDIVKSFHVSPEQTCNKNIFIDICLGGEFLWLSIYILTLLENSILFSLVIQLILSQAVYDNSPCFTVFPTLDITGFYNIC